MPVQAETVLAFYGIDRLRFTAPVFIGDTVRVETEVVNKEERRPDAGLVTLRVEATKASGHEVVVATQLKLLIRRAR